MILVFLASIIVVYGSSRIRLPAIILQGVFLLLIAYVYNGKDDLFWLVWYFVISDAPGRLFTGLYHSNLFGLPAYSIAPGITLAFHDIFLVMFLVKTNRITRQFHFLFKRQIWLIIGLGAFYFVLSFALGISFQNMFRAFRFVFYWLWPLVAARLITKHSDLERLFNLLFPIVLIGFLMIIQTYLTGYYLHNILTGISRFRAVEASEEELGRVLFSSSIMGISLVLSIYLLFKRGLKTKSNPLVLCALLSALSIFLSATRGWMLLLVIMLTSFFFMRGFGFWQQMVRIIVFMSLLAFIMIGAFPIIASQSSMAFNRLLTLEEFAGGDVTAGGTLARVDIRSPRVMAVWRDSPVIGWAFSNTFMQYMDIHVGNQTNLLNLGVLGFVILNLAFILILVKTMQNGRRHNMLGSRDNSHWVFILALIGFFVVHSTSTILWSLVLTSVSKFLIWAILLAVINVALLQNSNPSGESGRVWI